MIVHVQISQEKRWGKIPEKGRPLLVMPDQVIVMLDEPVMKIVRNKLILIRFRTKCGTIQ